MKITIETNDGQASTHGFPEKTGPAADAGEAAAASPGTSTPGQSTQADGGAPPAWLVEHIANLSSQGTSEYGTAESLAEESVQDGGAAGASRP